MSRRIFLTGATGYLGSAVAARLARAGHQVFGLTRHQSRAATLAGMGVNPVVGDLEEPDSFLSALRNCDAAIHVALAAADADRVDLAALELLRDACEDGRVRKLIYTSALWAYGDTGDQVVDETTPLRPEVQFKWRAAHEEIALDLVDREVDVTVFRPGIVYGEARGIVGALFGMARDRRFVVWPGDGSQGWSLVHREDVAEAYRLALDYARGGERYVLTDGGQYTAREVAEAVAGVAGVPARSWDREEVLNELGPFGEVLLTSRRASSARARRELGWTPKHASFTAEAAELYGEWQNSQGTPVV